MARRLIITADDYGMCEPVNRAIEKCVLAGGVTSFNVMANMEAADSSAEMRRKYDNISMGLHWTLTTGAPVSEKDKIHTIVDDNGDFYSREALFKKFNVGRIIKEHILTELKAQYDKYVKLCGRPDYWNSHENVHVAFGMIDIFTRCARELGMDKMRSHDRIYVNFKKRNIKLVFTEFVKRRILKAWYKKETAKGVKMPYGLVTFMYHEPGEDIIRRVCEAKWKDGDVGELVIHPADEVDVRYFGDLTGKRLEEYRLFSDENNKNIFLKENIELINFSGL